MPNADDAALVIRRVFDAPRDLVYDTMTDPAHLRHWWGPKECTVTVAQAEARPGGILHYCMRPREGGADMAVWGRFDFRELDRPERIVFVNGFADEEGNRIRYPLLPMWPLEVLNTITLEEGDGGTVMTLHSVPIDASEAEFAVFLAGHASMEAGFGGMYDVYEAYLQTMASSDTTDREIVLTRTLQAPRELVFDAFTDPAQVGKWWGPRGYSVAIDSMEARPGGSWRFEMTGPDGKLWPNLIEYSEVVRPERLVYRHGSGADGDPGFAVRVTFEDAGNGATLLTMHTVFASAETLAAVKKFGAEELGNQTIDKLAAFLAGAEARP
ncbi:uncharacterized protein YndB with AHSA1/START domain [Pseudoduganella lurida]|uniref:Uncharacterized protein YndB with AHSA1/START domain n=1 Tax=Pseudoduganella lurida TaxID=1036180 RepID=A0A562QZX3_9BURK|nr:SRPBCC family protein [Pseudoduganella lurida]TWI61884.1 uncharacterized protein YndB with AHSA1/START domain [Pseudoduganella lurida]